MLITKKIEQITRKYSDARYTVGEFLIKEKRNLKQYSMQEIADLTYTPRYILVQVAKILGFKI